MKARALLCCLLLFVVGCSDTSTRMSTTPEQPKPTAPTASISASASSIMAGQSTNLTWATTNADTVTIDVLGPVAANGSQSVSPSETTTYHLKASGSGGSATAAVQITVTSAPPPAPTASISASPTSINKGQSTTLTWTTANADTVTLNGVGVELNGTNTISPSETTTYTLVATGKGGTVSESETVTVIPPENLSEVIDCWGDSLTTHYTGDLVELTGLSVYNGGVAGETSTQIAARMLADSSKYGDIVVIWAGRNNYTSPTQVLSDIASMVSALSIPKRFLIMSVINGESPTELKGQNRYNQIISLNASLSAAYPDNYFDIRSYLVGQYNSQDPDDLFDYANDTVPHSLRQVDWIEKLSADVGSSDTLLTIVSQYVAVNEVLTIDSEMMLVTSVSGSGPYIVAVNRGYAGTQVSPHDTGTNVTMVDGLHLSPQGYSLVAQQVDQALKSRAYIP